VIKKDGFSFLFRELIPAYKSAGLDRRKNWISASSGMRFFNGSAEKRWLTRR
jgi:hypothetical protein